MMKYLVVIILLLWDVPAHAGDREVKVYATACDGHHMGFLIVSGDSVWQEHYDARAKASVYTRKKQVLSLSATKEITSSEEGIAFGKKKYLQQSTSALCGEYTAWYHDFGSLNNLEKLNVCRNLYACKYFYRRHKGEKGKWRSFEQVVKDNHVLLKMDPDVFLKEMK